MSPPGLPVSEPGDPAAERVEAGSVTIGQYLLASMMADRVPLISTTHLDWAVLAGNQSELYAPWHTGRRGPKIWLSGQVKLALSSCSTPTLTSRPKRSRSCIQGAT